MVDDMEGLAERRCEPCRGGVAPLSAERAAELAAATSGWRLEDGATSLARRFEFRDFV